MFGAARARERKRVEKRARPISIVISACLIADPEVLQNHRVPLSIDVVDPRHCLMAGATAFRALGEEHPGWRIVKWRCGAGTSDNTSGRSEAATFGAPVLGRSSGPRVLKHTFTRLSLSGLSDHPADHERRSLSWILGTSPRMTSGS